MKYRLFHGTKPLTEWTEKPAKGKTIDEWKTEEAEKADIPARVITVATLKPGGDNTPTKKAATKKKATTKKAPAPK